MFIKKIKLKNNDNIIYLVESYREQNGNPRNRIIKKIGLESTLTENDPKAIEKLRVYYKTKTKNNHKEIQEKALLDVNKNINNAEEIVNIGYFYLEKIFNDLNIRSVIKKEVKKTKIQYNVVDVLKLIVFDRIIWSSSKIGAYEKRNNFFENINLKEQDIYKSLSFLSKISDLIQKEMHKNIVKKYNRKCSLVLYDVTNYYFEIEKEDKLKRKGVSKENKPNPIVQMSLLIDENKIPIAYEIFPGNMHDTTTFIPMINKIKDKFGIDDVVVVADKGISSLRNTSYLLENNMKYVVSKKVRGTKKEFKKLVLDDEGYKWWGDDFKLKEVFRNFKDANGVNRQEKLIIFWSKNYSVREEEKQKIMKERINNYLKNPSKLRASNKHGMKKYIDVIKYDDKTGEVFKGAEKITLNDKKIKEDQSLNGYYVIATSELDWKAEKILASYKSLWKIEESFKVMKSSFKERPIYVRRNDRINAHFLTCFIGLTILRILEKQTKLSGFKLKNTIANTNAIRLNNDFFVIGKLSDNYKHLDKVYGVKLNKIFEKVENILKYRKEIQDYKF